MDENTLAVELLHQLKSSSKRWFIAFCIMVALEVITIFSFLWYISLPVDEYSTSYQQDVSDIHESDIRQIIGDDGYGESETDSP